jgi:hypothetical protein
MVSPAELKPDPGRLLNIQYMKPPKARSSSSPRPPATPTMIQVVRFVLPASFGGAWYGSKEGGGGGGGGVGSVPELGGWFGVVNGSTPSCA